jgi:hypothetical protein
VIGGLRVRGWTWLLSVLWVLIGAGGAIYGIVTFSHVGYGQGVLWMVQWPGEPQVIIDVAVVALPVWVLLSVPVLVAGFVRLRGLPRVRPRLRVDSHVLPRELQADRIAVDADYRCACGCQSDRVSANAAAQVGDNPGALRAAGWAGSWVAGWVLMNQTADLAAAGEGSSRGFLSVGELVICVAWLALGGVMTWILSGPQTQAE